MISFAEINSAAEISSAASRVNQAPEMSLAALAQPSTGGNLRAEALGIISVDKRDVENCGNSNCGGGSMCGWTCSPSGRGGAESGMLPSLESLMAAVSAA